MRTSPRRRVTPVASRWASRGKMCFLEDPNASLTTATVTPPGWSPSSRATTTAASLTADAANHTPSRSTKSGNRLTPGTAVVHFAASPDRSEDHQ